MAHLPRCVSLSRLAALSQRAIVTGRTAGLQPSFSAPAPPRGTTRRGLNIDSNYPITKNGTSGRKNGSRNGGKTAGQNNNAATTPRSRGRQSYRFVDRTRVRVSGGGGGNGSLSMFRIGRKQKRRPDGGHGGNGGSVLIVADPNEQSLRWTRPHVVAEAGTHGTSQEMHGRRGRNTVLRVPCGVVVRRLLEFDEYYDLESKTVRKVHRTDEDGVEGAAGGYQLERDLRDPDHEAGESHLQHDTFTGRQTGGYLASNDYDSDEDEDSDDESYDHEGDFDLHDNAPRATGMSFTPWGERERVEIADLDEPGSYVVVARGGRGGLGSSILASKHGPLPPTEVLAKYAKPKEGETAILELELKLIADIGLVGFPNAGKSSLLAATSRATPHIAPYPFTTLNPLVGYIEYRDGFRICAADVPGLIAGASEGRGKGHDFLRHLERTKALLYIVDAAGVDGRDPIADFETLVSELEAYGDGDMLNRRCLVVANKLDLLLQDERQEIMGKLQEKAGEAGIRMERDVIGISAGVTGEGLSVLTKAIRQTVLASEDDKIREQNFG